MMVDEADVDVVGMLSRGTKRPMNDTASPRPNNRRKPGPLPKDYTASRGSLSPRPASPALGGFSRLEIPEKATENEKPPEIVAEKSKPSVKNILVNSQKNTGLGVLKNASYKANMTGSTTGIENCTPEVDGEEMELDVEMNGVRGESKNPDVVTFLECRFVKF